MKLESIADTVTDWVVDAIDAVELGGPNETVRFLIGPFVGFYPDGDEIGSIDSQWSTALGIYLDIPGVEPLPEQRTFGTVIVQPWAATREMVINLVDDALRRMFRDRQQLAVEGRKRLDEMNA